MEVCRHLRSFQGRGCLTAAGGSRKFVYASSSRRQLFERFLSNAGLYGVSLVVTRLGWLLLLPLYWTRLSPGDYGIIGIAQVLQTVLNPVLSLGLYDAIQRFYPEWVADDRQRNVAALWTASLVFSLAVCGLLEWGGPVLAGWAFSQVPFDPYLRFALWTAFLANLGFFPLAILRIREQVKTFTVITVGSFLSQAAITIVLVIGFDQGPRGYLLGMLLNASGWAVYFVVFMLKESAFPFRWSDVRQPLRYSLPTVPVSILDGIASVFDRYFLDKYVNLAQIGLYNLGNQFGSAFNVFNQMLKSSWFPFLYRVVSERKDAPEILGRFSVLYLTLLAIPALAIALLSEELIEWFGDARFRDIYSFVPWFVLIYYVQAIATAMGRGLDLAKKTSAWPLVPLVSIAVSLTSLSMLVPLHGLQGALWALVIAAGMRALVQVGLSLYVYPRPLYFGRLLTVWAVCGVVFFAGYQINAALWFWNVVTKIGLIVLGALICGWVVVGRGQLIGFLRGGITWLQRPV
jgi:O-antigen/teichoic acid export membrane protein